MSVQLPNGQIRSSDLVYQNKHHGDMVFDNRYFEKFAIWNDDCDGLIWEKEHKSGIIIARSVWYPGFYSNNVSWTAHIIPEEGYVSDMYSGEPGSFQYLTRTKDFGINGATGAYENPYGSMRVSPDGVHWTNGQRCPGYSASSWSIKENLGVTYGRDQKTNKNGWNRLELDGNGKLTVTFLGDEHPNSGQIGGLAIIGTEQDGEHQWYKFMKPDGTVYVSSLPASYTWINGDTVIRTGYNWSWYYLNGKYIVVDWGKYEITFWDPINRQWVTLRSVLMVTSDDGFRTITSKYLENPIVGGHFQNAAVYYYNNHFWIWERGYDIVDGQNVYYMQFWEDFLPPLIKHTGDKIIQMPLIGWNHDPNVDRVNLIINGTKTAGEREINKSVTVTTPHGIYFKDGKPVEPYGYWVMPTPFRKNGWSSNSWDRGGFMVLKGHVTDFKTAQNDVFLDVKDKTHIVTGYNHAFAIESSEYMLDPDNATDGTDEYRIYTITNQDAYSKCPPEKGGTYKHIGYFFQEEDSIYGIYTGDSADSVEPYFAGEVKPNRASYIEIRPAYPTRYMEFETEWNNHYRDFHLNKHLHISECVQWLPDDPQQDGRILFIPLDKKHRWLKHEHTVFDMRNDQYQTDSPFYSGEEDMLVTQIGSSVYNKQMAGQAYTFAVYTLFHRGYYTYGATTPLIISIDEPVATMNGAADAKNTRVIKHDDKFWYYQRATGGSLWPIIEGYYPDSPHFIDMASMGEWPDWDVVALNCLKQAHPLPEEPAVVITE